MFIVKTLEKSPYCNYNTSYQSKKLCTAINSLENSRKYNKMG